MSVALALDPAHPLGDELQRIALALIDDACSWLSGGPGPAAGGRAEAPSTPVHDARKRLKELRALLRLAAEPAGCDRLRRLRSCFRDAGRQLSAARDDEALLGTIGRLGKRFPAAAADDEIQGVLSLLNRSSAVEVHTRAAHSALCAARQSMVRVPLRASIESIEGGLESNYRNARRAMRRAEETALSGDFHEWRKREKEHWYHARMLEGFLPALALRERPLHALSRVLGEQHDLVVFRERCAAVVSRGNAAGGIRLLAIAREAQAELEVAALGQGAALFHERSQAFLRRITSAWSTAGHPLATAGRG